MIQNTILNQLNEKGFVVSKIRGVSMWPFFNQKNTQVYIKRTPNYKKNDCILFLRSNGQLILHRILKVKDAYFLVSGDNESVVEKVYLEQINDVFLNIINTVRQKHLQVLDTMYTLYL